ncbi:c-type cytochrome [Chloroflexota bacterium]
MAASKLTRNLGLVLVFALALLLFSSFAANAQAGTQDQTDLGARLYAENCAVCHGPTGEGRVGATLSKNWPSIRPDLTVKSIITNGVAGTAMSAWSQESGGPLNAEEVDALVSYILTWQIGGPPQITDAPLPTSRPAITPIPNVEGDPNNGAILYDQNCVLCHGVEGEGRIGATLAKDWPAIRPDLSIKNIIASGVSGTVMPAWSQEAGGPLSATQVDDLVAYLMSWQTSTASTSGESASTPETLTPLGAWLRSWGGVLVFIVLLGLTIGAILAFQRRS